jgi:hypothetical protein
VASVVTDSFEQHNRSVHRLQLNSWRSHSDFGFCEDRTPARRGFFTRTARRRRRGPEGLRIGVRRVLSEELQLLSADELLPEQRSEHPREHGGRSSARRQARCRRPAQSCGRPDGGWAPSPGVERLIAGAEMLGSQAVARTCVRWAARRSRAPPGCGCAAAPGGPRHASAPGKPAATRRHAGGAISHRPGISAADNRHCLASRKGLAVLFRGGRESLWTIG